LRLNRRQALWELRALADKQSLALSSSHSKKAIQLPLMPLYEEVTHDYRNTTLTLRKHPVEFFREGLAQSGHLRSLELIKQKNHARVKVAGLVAVRQRPPTAKGTMFHTLEDESGFINIIIWPKIVERYRECVLHGHFLSVEGQIQIQEGVVHVIASIFEDLSGLLEFKNRSRDFH